MDGRNFLADCVRGNHHRRPAIDASFGGLLLRRLLAQMRSAPMSAIPPLSEQKRTLRSHLAGSINSVACRADRPSFDGGAAVAFASTDPPRPQEPRGLVLLFGRPEANPSQPNAHTTLLVPDPPGLRSAGLFWCS